MSGREFNKVSLEGLGANDQAKKWRLVLTRLALLFDSKPLTKEEPDQSNSRKYSVVEAVLHDLYPNDVVAAVAAAIEELGGSYEELINSLTNMQIGELDDQLRDAITAIHKNLTDNPGSGEGLPDWFNSFKQIAKSNSEIDIDVDDKDSRIEQIKNFVIGVFDTLTFLNRNQ